MYWNRARTLLFRILPITLFVLGCFPSRGLYFLLHPATPDGRYYSSHPVFRTPTNPTPKWKASRVPLPARLSRVPRTLKQNPRIPAPSMDQVLALIPDRLAFSLLPVLPDLVLLQTFPASAPPSRAPPAAI